MGEWLFKRDSALGSLAPIDILDTEVGGREVEELLLSLAHGQIPLTAHAVFPNRGGTIRALPQAAFTVQGSVRASARAVDGA